jgi:hypothetical protein
MRVPQVRCREILESDIDAIADLLTRGFSGRTREYWMRGLGRQGERPVPRGYPRYGYLLENDHGPVGVLLLLYTSRVEAGETTIRCNVSSWYVEPSFRIYATLLTSMAQKNKQVTYTNISPAVPTWPIIEAQGYKLYCRGLFFSVPVLSRAEPGVTVETVTPETQSIRELPQPDFELLANHAQYDCVQCRRHQDSGRIVQLPVRKPGPGAAVDAADRTRMGLANLAGAAQTVLALSDHQSPRALSAVQQEPQQRPDATSMIRKKPAPHLMRGGYRFSSRQARSVCAEIMLKQGP